jgi:uncharacterized lipoprotein NlpE involved in copper resistance
MSKVVLGVIITSILALGADDKETVRAEAAMKQRDMAVTLSKLMQTPLYQQYATISREYDALKATLTKECKEKQTLDDNTLRCVDAKAPQASDAR